MDGSSMSSGGNDVYFKKIKSLRYKLHSLSLNLNNILEASNLPFSIGGSLNLTPKLLIQYQR